MHGHRLLRSLLVKLQPLVEGCIEGQPGGCLLDFGPVPFPAGARNIRIVRHSASADVSPRIAADKACFAVSSFALSMLSEPLLFAQLQNIHALSQRVFFIDFKVPERNIEIPAAALFGGIRRLYTSSNSIFREEGGLEGLLHRERAHFRILERHTRLGGAVSCILAESL